MESTSEGLAHRDRLHMSLSIAATVLSLPLGAITWSPLKGLVGQEDSCFIVNVSPPPPPHPCGGCDWLADCCVSLVWFTECPSPCQVSPLPQLLLCGLWPSCCSVEGTWHSAGHPRDTGIQENTKCVSSCLC